MYKQLEHLQKKPKAKSFQHIHIKITSNIPAEKLELVEKVEKEVEGEEDLIDEDKEKEKKQVEQKIKQKIIDKRNLHFNRDIVFDKLLDKLPFRVLVQKDKETAPEVVEEITPIGEPLKKNKRVVIKETENETVEIPLEKEEDAEEVQPTDEDIEKEMKELSKIISEDEVREPEEMVEKIAIAEIDADVADEPTMKVKPIAAEKPAPKTAEAKKPRKLKLKIKENGPTPVHIDLTTAKIQEQLISERLPQKMGKTTIRAPTYYMNNRKIYVQKMMELLKPYKKDLEDATKDISCDKRSDDEFTLLTHQRVILDYLNLYTPYRGLLLYHGLGSGKSCSSIAIAEGMKTDKRVFILTPASLKMNFFSELKKCGDQLYKKNQYWEFVSIEGKPEYIGILSKALSLSSEYIRTHGGAWLVDVKKPSNFSDKTASEQKLIDEQLNEMIRTKYTDINYNGINMKGLATLTGDFSRNPFDNSVVVIDEAHNFVSRIVNKIKKPKTLPYLMYQYLMDAKNARIVLLTGTPIINYPNEIGILFNILRGYIKTWTFSLKVETTDEVNTDSILNMFEKANFRTYDYVQYSGNKLTITRNPFGFVNAKKSGVAVGTKRPKNVVEKVGEKVNEMLGGVRRFLNGGKTAKSKETKEKRTTKKKKLTVYDEVAKKITFEELPIEPEASAQRAYEIGYNGESNPHKGGGEVFDKYNGVRLDDTGNISDEAFEDIVRGILEKNGLKIVGEVDVKKYKALPDDADTFLKTFVNFDDNGITNMDLFQKRILGLTSYFRSAQEKLLPSFVKSEDGDIFHIVKCEMTPYQFGVYEKIRDEEAETEKRNRKNQVKAKNNPGNEDVYSISSTYRIFSRSACNFAFPAAIPRPMPEKKGKEMNENAFNGISKKELKLMEQADDEEEDVEEETEDMERLDKSVKQADYLKRIAKAMEDLKHNPEAPADEQYLSKSQLQTYSPKFVELLNHLQDEANGGLHLVYSQFRTIEGIGIIKLILEANGFAEFKLENKGGKWDIVENEKDTDKPRFVLYTGTETPEEKEIIRNIYNSSWEFVPSDISAKLQKKHKNNHMGEVIKVFMITSSGAEGINLKNTRFVHIVEPYWHMVRIEQVIGRARRICSHQDLPEDLRTVKVFLYLSVLSAEQKKSEKNVELRIRDVSRLDGKTPVTTDETLFEIASIKNNINKQILKGVKETSVDCSLYAAKNKNEPLVCYGIGKITSNQFGSYPSYEEDSKSEKSDLNVHKITWKAQKIKFEGVEYALKVDTNEVFDLNSYEEAKITGSEMILVGHLVKKEGKFTLEKI
uniref:Helicase ATP-binding domain-containing protein n=1 Tax=viral metagenome TaxID=1070528 RepID=A0A6C0LTI0_9ZZZZ